VAPAWAADKRGLIADARARLERDDTWQGKARHAPDRIPAWFDPAAEAGPEE
jgi:radical SAM superfamily enzyme